MHVKTENDDDWAVFHAARAATEDARETKRRADSAAMQAYNDLNNAIKAEHAAWEALCKKLGRDPGKAPSW